MITTQLEHEANPNDQNGSYGLPTLWSGPRFRYSEFGFA